MDWLNALGMCLLVIGHCEVLVTLMNRTHSFPIHFKWLRHFRHLDDLMIPAFPIIFFWSQGLRGAGLLTGGSWLDLPWRWVGYLSICGLGTIGFTFSVIRWHLYRTPEAHRSTTGETFDIQRQFDESLIGDGPYRFLAWFPLNECLKLNVARKELVFPNLPVEWDGMTITHLSDLHLIGSVKRPYFEEVARRAAELNSDLIVFTGDLVDRMHCLDWLPTTLGQLDAPLGRFFLLGNHDWDLEPEVIRQRVLDQGWNDLSSRVASISFRGRQLVVGGTEFPWMGTLPNFELIPEGDFRILLSHTPDNFDWAAQQHVDLMLAGHTHGGQVILPLIGPVYSPSRHGVQYSAGTFVSGPTLMHVSRGIAGKHPLRWRCPPELVQLKLVRG